MSRITFPTDLLTRPYLDLDDVQARIGAAVAFADERLAGRDIPAGLADELRYAREMLVNLADIKDRASRARAFRAEYGIETMKGLWFAFADHAAVLDLQRIAA